MGVDMDKDPTTQNSHGHARILRVMHVFCVLELNVDSLDRGSTDRLSVRQ